MWVTIIADASYCPQTKKAGYGFWIASKRGKKGGDGILKGLIENNIAAEMMALLNALAVAEKNKLLKYKDSILLQTDCQGAIDAFNNSRRCISKQEKELVEFYNKFCSDFELHVRLKHVKGHTNKEDARYLTNRICDRKARSNMRKARQDYLDNRIREFLNEQPRT